jgi:hypothetical protein
MLITSFKHLFVDMEKCVKNEDFRFVMNGFCETINYINKRQPN